MSEEYISTSEAAEILNVSIKTITNWIDSEYLTAFKKGPGITSSWHILRSSVEEKLPEKQVQTNN